MAIRLPTFDADFPSEDWENWKILLENYLVTQKARQPSDKYAHLIIQGGTEMSKLLKKLPDENEAGVGSSVSLIQNNPFRLVLNKLDEHFSSRHTPFAAILEFWDLKQACDEPVKKFLLRLREVARKCNFREPEREIQEQLIRGGTDLLVKNKATLRPYHCIDDVVAEMATNQTLNVTRKEQLEINYVNQRKSSIVTCRFCKTEVHIAPKCRKLREHLCKICQKRGPLWIILSQSQTRF